MNDGRVLLLRQVGGGEGGGCHDDVYCASTVCVMGIAPADQGHLRTRVSRYEHSCANVALVRDVNESPRVVVETSTPER